MKTQNLLNIKSFSEDRLRPLLAEMGMKPFRMRQVREWIYRKHARTFEEMTNISKADQELLGDRFTIPSIRCIQQEISRDQTRKFLFELEDGHRIESVLIPDEDRRTLCISSQVGCAQACRFCLTARGGFARNLRFFEIVDQVLWISRLLAAEGPEGITNIVLMGMGEPLANFEEVAEALRLITSGSGLGISPRRVTLSTAGLVPEIGRLGASGLRVNLAVSLNAASDEVRSRIMPVNRRWPLAELLAACRRYPLEPRRRITFEYVLLKGVNDSEEDARRTATVLRGIKCKVNLIPYNPSPGSDYERPSDAAVRRFQTILLDRGFTAPIRESRGQDISAACGQLRERAGE